MKRYSIFCVLILLFCHACNSKQPIEWTNEDIKKACKKKLDLLVKSDEVKEYFKIEDDGVSMFASPQDKAQHKVEAKIYYDEVSTFVNLCKTLEEDSLIHWYQQKGVKRWQTTTQIVEPQKAFKYQVQAEKPLMGLKVALDPGHVGGSMETAIREAKYILQVSEEGDTLRFNEGTLTLATALLLKDKLEKLGAEVLLSRNELEKASFGKSFDEWLVSDFENELNKLVEKGEMTVDAAENFRKNSDIKTKHRFFNNLDIIERAQKINAFQPHLSLVIHFNVDEPNWRNRTEDGVFPRSSHNYSMVFTPGSFMKGELKQIIARVSFLRLLLSDDLDNSVKLSKGVMDNFVSQLGVPAVQNTYELGYLKRGCIYTGPQGVYARNLSLTRLIKSPLCYGESLCQDNEEEAQRLVVKDIEVQGVQAPKRVEVVAEAYLQGILEYVL